MVPTDATSHQYVKIKIVDTYYEVTNVTGPAANLKFNLFQMFAYFLIQNARTCVVHLL